MMTRPESDKKLMRRKRVRVSGLAITLLLLAACTSSGPTVTYQESIRSFGAYRTFAFAQPLSTDEGDGQSYLSELLVTYTKAQMEPRGFAHSMNSPDLILDFNALVSDNIPTSSDMQFGAVVTRGGYWGPGFRGPGFWGPGYWGPRYWSPGFWGAGMWRGGGGVTASGITVTKEGTLFIRVIERGTQRVVWDGSATERVTNETINNLEPFVEKAVKDMFMKFPATMPN